MHERQDNMSKKRILGAAIAVAAACGSMAAQSAEWSDTSIGYRYGTKFAEPFGRTDIKKDIYSLTHVSGYKYGTNFFNADLLQSDNRDPAVNGSGAQEVYVVYRHTFDFGKISGKNLKWGIIRGWGATVGFDWNTKNDVGYSSKKRMLVAGPTVMFDVPGFLNVSLLALDESNSPTGYAGGRYTYKTHAMLTAAWGIPIGSYPVSFEGFMNIIAPKGTNEFGGSTATETNFDGQIMFDVGAIAGGPKGTFKLGVGYQYWKNKFGNPAVTPGAGSGAFAKTPMIRAEYHF
jgi:hypothetical protein